MSVLGRKLQLVLDNILVQAIVQYVTIRDKLVRSRTITGVIIIFLEGIEPVTYIDGLVRVIVEVIKVR